MTTFLKLKVDNEIRITQLNLELVSVLNRQKRSQFLYPRKQSWEGWYIGITLSVRLSFFPSVCPSVQHLCPVHIFLIDTH